MDIWSWFVDPVSILSYGYVGILFLSFAASLLIFVPIPYFLPLAVASIFLDPTLTSLSSAVGATVAKTIIFRGAYLGRRLLDEKTRQRLQPFEKLVSRYGWVAAFIAAVTPVPDDIVYIPLGLSKYSLWRFVAATFSGKLILTLIIAWGARYSMFYVQLFIEGVSQPIIAVLVAVILLASIAIVVYAILRLDWGRILGKWFPWTTESYGKSIPQRDGERKQT